MRKRTLGAIVLAGMAVSGAGAFTASNTVADSVAGYGTAAVSGVTVTNTAYTLLASDQSKITAITFTHASDLTGKTVKLGLTQTTGGVTSAVTAPNSCVGSVGSTVCTFASAPLSGQDINSFNGLALTVVQ